jgi:hypothetical protein
MNQNAAILTEKIQMLSDEQIAEVEDFVEFLRLRGQERGLTRSAATISTPSFEAIWANQEDDAYDASGSRNQQSVLQSGKARCGHYGNHKPTAIVFQFW